MGRSALIACIALGLGCQKEIIEITGPIDAGTVCSPAGSECPPGWRCSNRTCYATCTGGTACPDSAHYCEGPSAPLDICAPVKPYQCTGDGDCPALQVCFGGLCAAAERRGDGGLQPCTPGAIEDGCGTDAICYVVSNTPTCMGLSACAQDGGCPGASISDVCNRLDDGGVVLFPNKERICVVAYCNSNADCRFGAQCQHKIPSLPFGQCISGGPADPCYVDADCFNATGCRGADGGPDDGGFPGFCFCASHDAGVDAGAQCP